MKQTIFFNIAYFGGHMGHLYSSTRIVQAAIVCILAVGFMPSLLVAQEFAGFRGNVTDPSGNIIPGVEIRFTQEAETQGSRTADESGFTRSTLTNDLGQYEARGLLPGKYTIRVEFPGFKTYINRGVITYARYVRRVNIQLELGDIAESITVEEAGAVIETDTSTTTYKIANKELYSTMNNGWIQYADSYVAGNESRRQSHGHQANNKAVQVDGFPVEFMWRAGTEQYKEWNVVAVNAAAEYQHAFTVASTSPSGTNSFHSEAYVNVNHPRLSSLSPDAKIRPEGQRLLKGAPRVDKSFVASGPFWIPKIYDGRNKSFFFFLHQPRTGVVRPYPITGRVYPHPAMRAGNLSTVTNQVDVQSALCSEPGLCNPFTGEVFPGSVIPSEMISPIASRILSDTRLVPHPNVGGPGNLFANFEGYWGFEQKSDWWMWKFDQAIGPNNNFMISHYRFNDVSARIMEFSDVEGATSTRTVRAISMQDTHTFSPRLVNEFLFSWHRQRRARLGRNPGNDVLSRVGISDFGGRRTGDGPGSPQFIVTNYGEQLGGLAGSFEPIPVSIFGGTTYLPAVSDFQAPRVFVTKDTMSYQTGPHLLKWGIDITWERPTDLQAPVDSWGRWEFTGNFTGHDLGDFLLGLPYTTKFATARPELRAAQLSTGFFIQDDWKARRDLTLNLGVRFQHYGPPIDMNGLFYNFDFENLRVVVPDKGLRQISPGYPAEIPVVGHSAAGFPGTLANFKFLLIEPRIGLAWRPFQTDTTVVRMGYGIFHVPFAEHGAYRGRLMGRRENGPFVLTEEFGPNQIVNGAAQLTLASGFPAPGTGETPKQSVYGIRPDTRSQGWPYDQQWNFTIEQDLGRGFAASIGYVGAKGTNWPYERNLQTPLPSATPFGDRPEAERRPLGPNFARVVETTLGGNSSYHGLELMLNRQFSKDFYLRAMYSQYRSINTASGGIFGSTTGFEVEDPRDLARERGYQDGVIPMSLYLTPVWDIPAGRGKQWLSDAPGWLNHLAGNWTVGYIHFIYGHRTTAAYTGRDPANVGRSGGRPDNLPGCDANNHTFTNATAPNSSYVRWNVNCFEVPPINAARYGTATRGNLNWPTSGWDVVNAFKHFYLTNDESGPYFRLQFRMNNPFWCRCRKANVGPQSTNIGAATFGRFYSASQRARNLIWVRLALGF